LTRQEVGRDLRALTDQVKRAEEMKVKTRHRKSAKWRKRTDSSPVAKGRRVKLHGTRNPRKRKHLGGKDL
jgi:hypothetical protein